MKVERDKLSHWLLLIISAANIFLSIPFRVFRNKHKKRVVFFYQMHGNSKVLADYLQTKNDNIELYFLAFPEYLRIYKNKHDLPTLNMLNPLDMIKVAQSDVVITNYGALTLVYYAKFTSLKFVDVWHGLPMLKNQTPKIMNYLNYYTEVWVSSLVMKKFYETQYKLKSMIVPTGYGRVDQLVNGNYDSDELRKKYVLPDKKIILIAPTWKHNNPERSIFPFDMSAAEFLNKLNQLAEKTNSFVIFRAHMLSGGDVDASKLGNIKALSSQDYPDTEELLAVSDMVVTDWSSLVFDFMVSDRPTIFLDSQTPFTGPEMTTRSNPNNRFGPIVKSFEEFEVVAMKYLENPDEFKVDFAEQIEVTKEIAYGDTLDGQSTDRYYLRLKKMLDL